MSGLRFVFVFVFVSCVLSVLERRSCAGLCNVAHRWPSRVLGSACAYGSLGGNLFCPGVWVLAPFSLKPVCTLLVLASLCWPTATACHSLLVLASPCWSMLVHASHADPLLVLSGGKLWKLSEIIARHFCCLCLLVSFDIFSCLA